MRNRYALSTMMMVTVTTAVGLVLGLVVFSGGGTTATDDGPELTAERPTASPISGEEAVRAAQPIAATEPRTPNVNLDRARERGEALLAQLEDGGTAEGITVHGHWTIDISDPDGTLVKHLEFENALQSAGAAWLAGLLAGSAPRDRWTVGLLSTGGADVCGPGGSPAPCSITELSTDLTVEVVSGDVLKLSGSVNATNAGDVDLVSTFQDGCSCTFTSALTPFSLVSLGQQVQVSVEISFQ